MFIRGLIFLLCVSGLVWAQVATAALSGTVTDEAGRPLSGVQITARYLNTGNNWSEVTGEEGKYRVPALPLGSYLLTASLAGFKTDIRGVPIRTRADEIVVDFVLEAEAGPEPATREVPPEFPEARSQEPSNPPAPQTARIERAVPEPEPSPPPIGQPAPNPPSSQSRSSAGFSVQVASFRPGEKAEELQEVLQNAGYPVEIVEADIPETGRFYRVRVGPFATREEAQEAASSLLSRFPERIPDVWIASSQP